MFAPIQVTQRLTSSHWTLAERVRFVLALGNHRMLRIQVRRAGTLMVVTENP